MVLFGGLAPALLSAGVEELFLAVRTGIALADGDIKGDHAGGAIRFQNSAPSSSEFPPK